jgi:hypothetical protein
MQLSVVELAAIEGECDAWRAVVLPQIGIEGTQERLSIVA